MLFMLIVLLFAMRLLFGRVLFRPFLFRPFGGFWDMWGGPWMCRPPVYGPWTWRGGYGRGGMGRWW